MAPISWGCYAKALRLDSDTRKPPMNLRLVDGPAAQAVWPRDKSITLLSESWPWTMVSDLASISVKWVQTTLLLLELQECGCGASQGAGYRAAQNDGGSCSSV